MTDAPLTPERIAWMDDKLNQQDELIAEWRKALREIANAESGTWGWIARQALEKEKS
jgi:hypothetical protein